MTVTNSKGEKQYVKSVEVVKPEASVAAVGETTKVKVEFYDDLKSGETYTFDVKVGEETVSQTLEFEIGEPAEIVVEDQVVPAGENTAIEYKVLDADGLDITKNTEVEFVSNNADAEDGKVTLADGDVVFVEIVTSTEDGEEVRSDRFKVSAEARVAAEISNWSLDTAEAFDHEDYEQDSTIALDESGVELEVELTDQFGDVLKNADRDAHTVVFESLDPAKAVVDAETGEVTPRSEGSVPVKITVKKGEKTLLTQTVELEVVAKSTPTAIEVSKEEVTLYSNVSSARTAEINVKVVDQYDGKVNDATIKASVKSGKDLIETPTVEGGKLSIEAKEGESGTATIELTSGELTKTITVIVKESGEIADYVVDGAKEVLDVNSSNSENDKNYKANEMKLSVTPVDENGEIAADNVEFKFVVTDSENKEVTKGETEEKVISLNDVDDKGNNLYKVGETYTVKITVGSLPVDSFTFEVVDTRKAPEYTIKANEVTVGSTSANFNELFQNTILEFENENVKVTDVDFVSTKATVFADNDTEGSSAVKIADNVEEVVTIYVDTVTVKDDKGTQKDPSDDETYVLDFSGEKVNVTVDTKASLASVTAPTTLTNNAESLQIVFDAEDASDLAYIEIDHSLGSNGDEDILPEFKLYADPTNVWGDEEDDTTKADKAEKLGVSASYDKNSQKWVLTFEAGENSALAKILGKASESDYAFKLYQKVVDVYGNTAGDMNDVTEEMTTTITIKAPAGEDA